MSHDEKKRDYARLNMINLHVYWKPFSRPFLTSLRILLGVSYFMQSWQKNQPNATLRIDLIIAFSTKKIRWYNPLLVDVLIRRLINAKTTLDQFSSEQLSQLYISPFFSLQSVSSTTSI